jgi:recombination protein RecA
MKKEDAAALQTVVEGIEKDYGAGAIMRLGSKKFTPVEVVPTVSLALDIALGVGGLPKGRIIEIYGPESGGKTTLCLQQIAQTQKFGANAAFIDAEHSLDPAYAARLGVNIDDLFVAQPDNGEQALEIVKKLVDSHKIGIIVVDSVAALVPRAELEGDMGDPQMGLQARMMSQAMRKLTAITKQANTQIIFINQIREKIGVMFGNPETTTGGRALKFYASVRLDIRKLKPIKVGDVTIGTTTRIKVVKNKVAPPYTEAEVDLLYGYGISREIDLLRIGEEQGVLEKSGSWFAYGGEKIGQSEEKARVFLVEHPEIANKIDAELRSKLFKKEEKHA